MLTLTSPFSDTARIAWYKYLQSPQNNNRSRPSMEKLSLIHELLGGRKAVGDKERRLKHDMGTKYRLLNGHLQFRKDGHDFKTLLTDYQVYDEVIRVHLHLSHAGIEKTHKEVEVDFYGITHSEISWILRNCSTCAKKKTQRRTAPLKPIVVNNLWERVQDDLIDMRAKPDGEYNWICHMRDHFSKYSAAYPLKNKESQSVAEAVTFWITHLGPPLILHSDNGTEFKGALKIILKKHEIKVSLLLRYGRSKPGF